ncbi:MAG: hypothetical protein OHK006_18140 [Thermodesulfovibrionales bacterium]
MSLKLKGRRIRQSRGTASKGLAQAIEAKIRTEIIEDRYFEALKWKWTKENPVADVSFAVGNKNARERWLSPEEEQALISHATNPHWLRNLLILALHTGMRKGEILRLRWTEVDFSRRLILKSKNGEKRGIPMPPATLHATLKAIKVRDISGRVFPIADRSLRAAYDTALAKTGISDFPFHDLRHTFATRLVQNGLDLYELLGHKTRAMTMRYAHHYPESLHSSIEVLDSVSQWGHTAASGL